MISARQFHHLNEMGITLYQTRSEPIEEEVDKNPLMKIDINELKGTPLFGDILASLSLTEGEITFKDELIDFGLFNWSFQQSATIHFQDSQLISPPMSQLKQSSSLKRELWNTISTHLL